MQTINRKIIFTGVIVLAVIIGLLVYAGTVSGGPGKLDGFAQCLKDKGAIFYGAFWCQHCQNQKALFGSSKQYLPYVECSNPDGQSQTDICKKESVASYPTWVFPDLSTTTGELSLEILAQKTSCQLPK